MSAAGNLRAYTALLALPLYAARRKSEQWKPAREVARLQLRRLRAVLRKARAAPYYRRVIPDVPSTGTLEQFLASLPLLDKRIIADEGLDAFLTLGSEGLLSIFTSGSTGHPSKFLRSPLEETEFSARMYRVYSAYGGNSRDTILNVGSAGAKRRSGAATLLRDLGLLPKIQNLFAGAQVEDSVRTLREFRPRLITGYAVGIEKIAEHMILHGIEIDSPKAVICGAMDVTDRCRDLIERAFRAPAMNGYVTNEIGVIAWECPLQRGSLHVNDDVLAVEILDEHSRPVADGSIGEVVLTSLTLTRMPLIRYRTGDTAARIAEPCACGRGLSLMTRVQGRTAHTIVGPRGELFTTPTVAGIFTAASAYRWVRRFQVQEQEDRMLLILVEVLHEPQPTQTRSLLAEMGKVFGPAYRFRIEVRDELPLAPSGKYQYLVPLAQSLR
jgi:phenylacetate-CoA ligase